MCQKGICAKFVSGHSLQILEATHTQVGPTYAFR
jgi:hypothetical protein